MALTAKVSTKGQIVIPGPLRKKLRLEPGSQVDLFEYGDVICIAPRVGNPVEAAWGIVPPSPSLADELRLERLQNDKR